MTPTLFLGIPITPELRQAHQGKPSSLHSLAYQGKAYLGAYTDATDVAAIRKEAAALAAHLAEEVEDFFLDPSDFVLLPQLLLGVIPLAKK